MNKRVQEPIVTTKELEQKARELATPIDFESLVRTGVLEEHKGWYKIFKMDELPAHAKAKIHKVKSSNGLTLVRFRTPSKRLVKLLKMQ